MVNLDNNPFTIHYSLFTVHHSLFTIHYSPFTNSERGYIMKRVLTTFLPALLICVFTTTAVSMAQEKEMMKRSVGPASFYISMKDKVGITKEQEDKLMTIEKDAMKKLEEINISGSKAQQSLNNMTKEDEIDLNKAKELLKNIASLEADARYIIIETMSLEKKVLSKEQRDKVNTIAQEMSKGMQQQQQQQQQQQPVKK